MDQERFFLKAADYVLNFVTDPDGLVSTIDLHVAGQVVPLIPDDDER